MTSDLISSFRSDFRRIERFAGFRLRDDACCCDVTVAQCHAILEIGTEEQLNIKELAARLGLDKSTLSRTVENLVSEGLAERSASQADRRTVEIRLTDKGRNAFDRINTAADNHFMLVFQQIAPDKHHQIAESISLLAKALAQTDESDEGTSCCQLEVD